MWKLLKRCWFVQLRFTMFWIHTKYTDTNDFIFICMKIVTTNTVYCSRKQPRLVAGEPRHLSQRKANGRSHILAAANIFRLRFFNNPYWESLFPRWEQKWKQCIVVKNCPPQLYILAVYVRLYYDHVVQNFVVKSIYSQLALASQPWRYISFS